MSADPNKKSARSFQCRDVLWETFEQMARELECSIDYLINESMKQYARQRSYTPRPPMPGSRDGAPGSGPMPTGQGPALNVAPPPMAAMGGPPQGPGFTPPPMNAGASAAYATGPGGLPPPPQMLGGPGGAPANYGAPYAPPGPSRPGSAPL